jgi:hypothetical protein
LRQDIITYLPWLLSAITIWMTVLAGNKHKSAWLIGLANQALWLTWIITTGAWGLLPMTAALTFVYARNHLKWAPAGVSPLSDTAEPPSVNGRPTKKPLAHKSCSIAVELSLAIVATKALDFKKNSGTLTGALLVTRNLPGLQP